MPTLESTLPRTLILGDVHGMLQALRELIQRCSLQPEDRLIFVGDLLDKGPDSVGVVRQLRAWSEAGICELALVEGNHEEKHRRYRAHRRAGRRVAEQMKGAEELAAITRELSPEDCQFLETALPFLRIPELDLLVVHGGIPGTLRELPEDPRAPEGWTSKRRKHFQLIYRTRYLRRGRFVALGEEQPADRFWAEDYDGRFGHVVFGHQPFLKGPAEFPHATGIDTGAVFGGSLTALILEEDGRRRFLSQPCPRFAEPLGWEGAVGGGA